MAASLRFLVLAARKLSRRAPPGAPRTDSSGFLIASRTCVRSRSVVARRWQPPRYVPQAQWPAARTTTGLDVARFALLSAATLPFTAWIACFAYDYAYRVEICRKSLGRRGPAAGDRASPGSPRDTLVGREWELTEVACVLARPPAQIVVVAGGNEAGKSRFVAELLARERGRNSRARGVTHVQLAALVDSVSTFAGVLVDAFDLRWLRLRHALVDVLPFAGSEILVMKERFSDRDLVQGLGVITDALKQHAARGGAPPVIVIDGLGEGAGRWMGTPDGRRLLQRFLQWCVYATKERGLAHVVLTGNEQLVLSLADQHRATRGHVKVVGLGALQEKDAAVIVRRDLPDASEDEVGRILAVFGGFVHDVLGASRDIRQGLQREGAEAAEAGDEWRKAVVDEIISARFQQQVERVIAAFAKGREHNCDIARDHEGACPESGMDPYLDPLKSIYSEAQASQIGGGVEGDEPDTWTQLQLWKTLRCLVSAPQMAVSISELRDGIFDGNEGPILELMQEDVLGFDVDRSSDGGWSWKVTPASPALGKAFAQLVDNSGLKERFGQIEASGERNERRKGIELERARLRCERAALDLRKESLLRTAELGKELGSKELARWRLVNAFEDIVAEEALQDAADRILRDRLKLLTADTNTDTEIGETGDAICQEPLSLQSLLKSTVLDIVSAESSSEAESGDGFRRLKNAFVFLDITNDGISAADLAQVIKESTGEDVDISAAEEFVRQWDLNDDRRLNYNEFVRMLLGNDLQRSKLQIAEEKTKAQK